MSNYIFHDDFSRTFNLSQETDLKLWSSNSLFNHNNWFLFLSNSLQISHSRSSSRSDYFVIFRRENLYNKIVSQFIDSYREIVRFFLIVKCLSHEKWYNTNYWYYSVINIVVTSWLNLFKCAYYNDWSFDILIKCSFLFPLFSTRFYSLKRQKMRKKCFYILSWTELWNKASHAWEPDQIKYLFISYINA